LKVIAMVSVDTVI